MIVNLYLTTNLIIMRKFLASMAMLCIAATAAAQCTAPTNQPKSLTLKESATAISGEITPGDDGAQAADIFLVVISPANLSELPRAQAYTIGKAIGNGTVISADKSLKFKASNLSPKTKYFVYVFAGNSAGPCYNTEAPGSESTTTLESPDEIQENSSGDSPQSSKLSALMNFNFAGKNNGWTNLTPVVFYGWTLSGETKQKKKDGKIIDEDKRKRRWSNTFQVGPYIGSTIAIKDSTSYLPAIMLPGNAGLEANYFMTFGNEAKFSIVFSPLNLGIKVISGFSDTNIAVVQHNIRHAIGFRYADYISASVQYTTGWHNSTTFSQENFEKVFLKTNSRIAYLNIGLTTKIFNDLFGADAKTPVYLSMNWRACIKPKEKFDLPNSRIFTVGISTNLNLKSGSNDGWLPKVPQL